MKNYEGHFILNTAGKEEGADAILDEVSKVITESGGRVGEIRKGEQRGFARVAHKSHTAGFYATVLFELNPADIGALKTQLTGRQDVFRLMVAKP